MKKIETKIWFKKFLIKIFYLTWGIDVYNSYIVDYHLDVIVFNYVLNKIPYFP